MSRAGAALVVALALLLGRAPNVSAHAELAGADPPIDGIVAEAPGAVTLWFSERPEPRFSQVQVLDASARQVDRGDLRPDASDPAALKVSVGSLAHGTYTIIWRALSAVDGHVTSGAFAFTVGLDQLPTGLAVARQASAPVHPEQVVVRALLYLGLAGATGSFPFVWWVLLPSISGAVPPRTQELLIRRIGTLCLGSVVLSVVALIASLLAETAATLDVSALQAFGQPMASVAFGTRFGALWWTKLELLAGLGVLALVLRRGGPRPVTLGLGAVVGAGLLLTYALGAHASAAPGATPLATAIQWAHLVAVGLWIGGLACLLLIVWTLVKGGAGSEGNAVAANIVPRFSVLAATCVAILVLSGVYQGWLLVGSLAALPNTLYGETLLVKLALVAGVLLLGATNLLVLRPRLQRAVSRLPEGAGLVRTLRLTVGGELGFALAVFVATGVLSSIQTGRQATIVEGIAAQATAENVRATLRVQPGAAGANRFQVTLTDRRGDPLPGVEKVELRFSFRALDLGESELVASPRPDGVFGAQGGVLVTPGPWRIEAVIRRPGFDDVRPDFDFTIGPALPPGTLAFAADPVEGNLVIGAELAIAGLMFVMGLALVRPRSTRFLMPPAVGGIVIGCIVGTTSWAALGATVHNPIPPTVASIDRGKAIYVERCTVCHGEAGRGDGPAALGLNPRPADFRIHLAAGHTDAQLFDWVSNGYPASAMPAFRAELSEEDRWNVLNYIRSTFGPGVPSAR